MFTSTVTFMPVTLVLFYHLSKWTLHTTCASSEAPCMTNCIWFNFNLDVNQMFEVVRD